MNTLPIGGLPIFQMTGDPDACHYIVGLPYMSSGTRVRQTTLPWVDLENRNTSTIAGNLNG